MLWLLAGLGNPGRTYAGNRHNIGFMVIDELGRRCATNFGSKFKSDYARTRLANEDVILLKPTTFMNRSGVGVGLAASFFKIPAERVVVVHDELDHDFGRLQIKMGGGHAGHNGLRSIFEHFGKDFTRVRCGVGKPVHGTVSNYVLSDFPQQESMHLDAFVDNAADSIESIVRLGPKETMNHFN
jgi:PTH1 family peptidyl-tRNA hydrolase